MEYRHRPENEAVAVAAVAAVADVDENDKRDMWCRVQRAVSGVMEGCGIDMAGAFEAL
jgi:hypothetical protein